MDLVAILNLFGWITLILTVICQFSGLTKYYLKMIALPVMMAVGSLISLPRAIACYGDYRGNGLFFAKICSVYSYLLGVR